MKIQQHPKYKNYYISENGDVFRENRKLKTRITKFGYVQTWITENSKTHYKFIHRLVAETFFPEQENGYEINHINGIKTDNHVSNLEWVKRADNIKHAWDKGLYKKADKSPNSKLKTEDVLKIKELKRQGLSYNKIGKMFNVNHATIRNIWLGNNWKSLNELCTS
jgi:hypothetical protein